MIIVLCTVFATGCAQNEKHGRAGSDATSRAGESGTEAYVDAKKEGGPTGNGMPGKGEPTGNGTPGKGEPTEEGNQSEDEKNSAQEALGAAAPQTDVGAGLIRPEGMTLATRFTEPNGFSRVQGEPGTLTAFLREYPMKEDGSPVLLYDGREKGNQRAHAAVFALPIENEDLQQCADSVMRVYAEYFWESGQKERIAFHFVNGFYAEYTRWRDGGRIQVSGNEVSWVQTAGYDDSYENLKKYLRYVFSYAGTLSMEGESEPVSAAEITVGDVLLKGGSPGHVVMVVDLCEDGRGEKAFLLAQGYMPAQEFHVLNNPLHPGDPWYYERELAFPLATPEYTFGEGSLRRPGY